MRTGPYEVVEPAPAGVPDELRLPDVSEDLPQALAIPVKEAFLGIGELPHAGAQEVLQRKQSRGPRGQRDNRTVLYEALL